MLRSFSTPAFRSAISQFCGSFPYYCIIFAYGTALGFHINLIAVLYKQDSEIAATVDQISWFAGLDILSPLVLITNGILTQRFGSRVVALITTTWFTSSFLLYHYSTSITMVLVARLLDVLPATTELANPFISEISEPRFRGALLVFGQLCLAFGMFFSVLLANFLHWRTVVLINLVFPISAFVSVLFTPNSPAWLASKGRFDEAEKALCWLRGWVVAKDVQSEFLALTDNAQKSKTSSAQQNLDVEAVDWQKRSKQFFQVFLQRSFYLPLGTMCLAACVYALSGVLVTESFAAVLFSKLDSPIESSLATVIMGAAAIVGRFILLFCIHRVYKRKLICLCVAVVGLCYASIALVTFLKLQGEYLWIPPIAVITANLASHSGVAPILIMLASEVFPLSVRYIGTSISSSFYLICGSLMHKSYLYILEAIKLSGIFLLFAVGNIVALVTYYFVLPETEGKSLEEIENHYRGVKKLNEL